MSLSKAASKGFMRPAPASRRRARGPARPRSPVGAAVGPECLERRTLLAVTPVIVYDFNETGGEFIADSSPEGGFNNGTLAGDIPPWFGEAWDGSPAGGSYLHFEGSGYNGGPGGRVDANELLNPILGGSSSLAYYVRNPYLGNWQPWLSPAVTGAEQYGAQDDVFWGSVDQENGLRVAAGDNAGASTGGAAFWDGMWHHVVHTRDAGSGEVRSYLDGLLVSTSAGDPGQKGAEFRSIGAATWVALDLTTVISYTHFYGDLDHVEIYDRVLSARDVAQQYAAPADAAPATPAGLVAHTDAVNAVRLTWDGADDALGYVVRRAGSDGVFADVAEVARNPGAATETYIDAGLTPGVTYHYEVVAFNSHPDESAPATVSAVPQATGFGVNAYYYASPFWGRLSRPGMSGDRFFAEGDPDLATKVGLPINYEWGSNGPTPPFPDAEVAGTQYSTAFTGKIRVEQEADYGFVINTDDDGYLFVNGELAAAAPGSHFGYDTQPWGFYHLTPGDYDFTFFQAQGLGAAGARMKWVTFEDYYYNGVPAQPIPIENLIAESTPPTAPQNLTANADGQFVQLDFLDTATTEWRYVLERARGHDGAFEPLRAAPIVSNWGGGYGFGSVRDFVPEPGVYRYRLRAENADGASDAVETTVEVTGAGPEVPGAQGYYFNDRYWGTGGAAPADYEPIVRGSPDYLEVVGEVNYTWDGFHNGWAPGDGMTIQGDEFSTVFTGKIRTVEAGTYTFLAHSDDDSYFYVNGQLVSADPGGHAMRDPRFDSSGRARVVPIELEADTEYNFVALQSDGFGSAGLRLEWVRPDFNYSEPIPFDRYTGNRPNAAGGTPTGAPLAPQELAVSPDLSGARFLTLTWDDVATNELRYVLQRSASADFSSASTFDLPINANSYTDTTVAPGQTYHYRLRAVNFNGVSGYATTQGTTLDADPAPAAPQQLRGAARQGGVRLAFLDASANEDRFLVQRASASDPADFADVGTVPGTRLGRSGATLFFTDADAEAGQGYIYRVVAENEVGSAASNVFHVTAGSRGGTGVTAEYYNNTKFAGEPAVLSPVDADEYFSPWYPPYTHSPHEAIEPETYSAVFQGELVAEFSEAYTFHTAGDDGLLLRLIDRETGDVLLQGPPNALRPGSSMSPFSGFTTDVGIVNLTAGRRYLIEWRMIQDQHDAGYRVGWSSPSTPKEVLPTELLFPPDRATVPLLPVHGVAAAAVADEAVFVRWVDDNNFGETGFLVERKLASQGDGAFASVGTAPRNAQEFEDPTPLQLGQTYVYRVLAVRGDERGPAGAGATATVTPAVGGTDITYNGDAVLLPGADGSLDSAADNVLQLTDDQRYYWQIGSAYTTNARRFVSLVPRQFGTGAVNGFTASFDFQYPAGYSDSGEAFTFVIQRVGNDAIGETGWFGAFGGLPRSFAVGFHPAYNTTYAYIDGAIYPYNQHPLPFWPGFGNGSRVELEYDYDARTLRQRVTALDAAGNATGQVIEWLYSDALGRTGPDTVAPVSPLDLPALLGGTFGFVGFSATSAQLTQVVRNFRFNGEAIAFAPTAPPPPPPPPNAAPVADAGGPYTVAEGGSLVLDASGSSDADGDALTYAWDVNGDGDFTDAAGRTVTLTWQQLQALGIDDGNDDASLTIRVRVSDGQEGASHIVTASAELAVENAPPTATFYRPSGEGDLLEGNAAVYAFHSPSDPSAADSAAGLRFTYAADFNKDGEIDADEEVEASPAAKAMFFAEDGEYLVRGRVYDKDGDYSEYFLPVVVHNMAPTIETVTGPTSALPPNGLAELTARFHDDGHLDTHTAVWDWGDGTAPTAGVVSQEPAGWGTVGGSHQYAAPGLYTVKLTVTDDEGAAVETLYRHVVVYDPAGQVTGGGTIETAAGRGTFSLSASYRAGAATPSGLFQFTAPGVTFRSTGLDWLVVRGGRAYVRGTGTVNGQAGYAFQVTVLDGADGGADRVRVKVWNASDGAVVFDTQPDALDDADPTTLLTGGVEVRTA